MSPTDAKPLTEQEIIDGRTLLVAMDNITDGEPDGPGPTECRFYDWCAANLARLLATIDSLRAAVAEAEKQRDEANKPWNFRLMLPDPVDTYDAVDCRLVDTGHFDRLLILESGELNERLEELTASRDALAAELAEARKVVDDAVPFIACHGAVEMVKEHGNIESAENSEAILYRMFLLLGNHGAIERLGLKPAARISAGKASGGGENANPE